MLAYTLLYDDGHQSAKIVMDNTGIILGLVYLVDKLGILILKGCEKREG